MKKDNCNIIKDLLPSYIDDLTSKESNLLITTHLEECESCREVYKKMNNNIEVHHDLGNPEITYMKKIHKKFKILAVCIVVLIIIICISLYINYKSSNIYMKGKVFNEQFEIINNTYLLIEYEDNDTRTKFILTIDENDICQNARKVRKSKNSEGEKQINEEYNIINMVKDGDSMHSNCELKGTSIYYNYNAWNGLEKDTIISRLKQYNSSLYIEEF